MEKIISSKSYKIKLAPYTFDISINKNGFLRDINTESSPAARIHFHTQYELFFFKDADLVIDLEDKELTFSDGAVCVPPQISHSVKRMQNAYHLRFEITNSGDGHGEFYLFGELFGSEIHALTLNDEAFAALNGIKNALADSTPHQDEKISSYIKILFIELLEANTKESGFSEKDTVNDYFMIIEDFIHNRYKESITLSDVAFAIHLSEKQTARIIKKRYGSTFSSLILKKRLGVAAELLRSTSLPISSIAREVYGDRENYFYVNFKKEFGTTPLKYRKMYR